MNKILFIEDDIPTGNVYKDKFSKNYDVLWATTGIDGVSFAVRQKPEIIILDLMLGGDLNGFDVLRELKLHAETQKIPVIVLTNLEAQEAAVKEAGAVECFIKTNTSIDKIEDVIQKYLK